MADLYRLENTARVSSPVDDYCCNIAIRFREACSSHRDLIAVTDSEGSKSYGWLESQAAHIAATILARSEFNQGNHVGLFLENSAEYVAAFYGIALAGGVVVPVPTCHQNPRLLELCKLADLKLFIDSPSRTKQNNELPFSNAELIKLDANATSKFAPALQQDPDSLAMMLFTSGSTGDPKAVMLSHRNVLANTESIRSFLPITSADRALAITPFAHALGNSVIQTHILSGAQIVIAENLQFPSAMVKALQDNRCTSLTAVPEVFESVLSAFGTSEANLPDLKYMAVAGGKLDGLRAVELARKISPAQFFVMYGQTEATARLSYLPPCELEENANTIGRPIPGVELSVRDDSGHEVGSGVTGTLFARGNNIMLGYWNDTRGTQQVLNDGWLDTGDLASVRANGLIQLCGRKNGLIKTLGYRFHPAEVEQILSERLADVQLVATPMNFSGKTRLALFAKPRSQRPITKQEIQDACRQLLPRHMIPQRCAIVDRWPVNSANKIDRRALQNQIEGQPMLASGVGTNSPIENTRTVL